MIVFVMVVLPAGMYFFYAKQSDKKAQAFLAQNPNAVKVYLSQLTMSGIQSVSVEIEQVDAQEPVMFMEGLKSGFYLTPGTHTLLASASKTRPGVMHKTVSTEYGPLKLEVQIEIGKSYNFGFDIDQETFTLSERA